MSYIVTAPLVVLKKKDGSYQHIYAGGPVSEDGDAEHIKQLLAEKMIEKVKAAPAAAPEPKDPTVEEVLAEVGEDQDKAAAALEVEKTGKNRSSLVKKLEAIAAPSSDS